MTERAKKATVHVCSSSANIWNKSSEPGTVQNYTEYMWIILFLTNPIKQELQKPTRLSNDTEISWDNGIVAVFLKIDWIWRKEEKLTRLSQFCCSTICFPLLQRSHTACPTYAALRNQPLLCCPVFELSARTQTRSLGRRAPAYGRRCSWHCCGLAVAHRTPSWHLASARLSPPVRPPACPPVCPPS